MTFDTEVPEHLLQTQQWFGSVISQSINDESSINPIAPSGKPIQEEAPLFIAPSPTLAPHQRIELYHQQYWWRLLNTLQEAFPLTLRLFGYHSFNENIAKPYLLAYPPRHWSLNPLGDRMEEWVDKHYQEKDKVLLLNSVKLDYIYIDSFVSKELPPITAEDEAALAEKPLILQPYVRVVTFPYDLCVFRKAMMQESVEHWVENPFPPLSKKKRFYFVLSRTRSNDIHWTEVSLAEFLLLEQLKKPQTVMELCEWLESQKREIVKIASENLQNWFRLWTSQKWIAISK